MNRVTTLILTTVALVCLAVALPAGDAVARQKQKVLEKEDLTFISAEDAKFKDLRPGVSQAVIWGNPDKGPHGVFFKFVPGLDSGMHTHTNTVRLVVLGGAYLYKDAEGEKRVGRGQFIQIPGGRKHWSGGDAQEGALFYEESLGKFDLIPTK